VSGVPNYTRNTALQPMAQGVVKAIQKFHQSLVLGLQTPSMKIAPDYHCLMLCECLLWPRTHFIKEMLPVQDEDDNDESYDVCSELWQMI